MRKRERQQFTSILLGSGITGLGIGWLAGLSVSPVISIIITSVVGVVAAVVSALSGLDDKADSQATEPEGAVAATTASQWKVNPWPLAALLIGLILGSSAGIWTRTHNLLGVDSWTENSPNLKSEIQRWTDAGMDPTIVVERLFNRRFPEGGIEATKTEPGTTDTVLFDNPASPSECDRLGGTSTDSLPEELAQSEIQEFRDLAVVTSTGTLREVVDALCESIQQ